MNTGPVLSSVIALVVAPLVLFAASVAVAEMVFTAFCVSGTTIE